MSTVEELERCHRCGGGVEVYAKTCPHCSAALTAEKRKIFRRMVADGFVTEDAYEVIEQLLEERPLPPDVSKPGPRKQITDLTLEDLDNAPVWEFAIDEEGEPGQDEETVRPCPDLDVVDPAAGLFVVAARFEAADGTVYRGYVTPSEGADEADSPTILTVNGHSVPFSHGIREPSDADLAQLYAKLGKRAAEVFPLLVETLVPTTAGDFKARIEGFSYLDQAVKPQLKR